MDKTTTYSDSYKGVPFELAFYQPDYAVEGWWCSYFKIKKSDCSEKVWEQIVLEPEVSEYWARPHFSYMQMPLISNLPFHGGITFYTQLYCPEQKEIWAVKVGCDYHHYQDEEHTYTLEQVRSDIFAVIDAWLVQQEEVCS